MRGTVHVHCCTDRLVLGNYRFNPGKVILDLGYHSWYGAAESGAEGHDAHGRPSPEVVPHHDGGPTVPSTGVHLLCSGTEHVARNGDVDVVFSGHLGVPRAADRLTDQGDLG